MARGQTVSSNDNESSVIEPSAEASITDSVVMIESTALTGSAASTKSVVLESADGLATVAAELEVVTEGGGTEQIATETESADRPTQADPSAEAPPVEEKQTEAPPANSAPPEATPTEGAQTEAPPTENAPSEATPPKDLPSPEDKTTKGSDSTTPPPEVSEQCYRPTRLFGGQGKGLLDTVQSILTIQQGLIACSKEGKESSSKSSDSMETTTQIPSLTPKEEKDDHSIRGIPLNGKEERILLSESLLSLLGLTNE